MDLEKERFCEPIGPIYRRLAIGKQNIGIIKISCMLHARYKKTIAIIAKSTLAIAIELTG